MVGGNVSTPTQVACLLPLVPQLNERGGSQRTIFLFLLLSLKKVVVLEPATKIKFWLDSSISFEKDLQNKTSLACVSIILFKYIT